MPRSVTISEFLSHPALGLEEFVQVELLTRTVEDNEWHNGQSVWDHGMRTYRAVDKIISLHDPLLRILSPIKSEIAAHMDSTFGTHPRRVLMKVAALLHDIGKVSCVQTGLREQTACPGHAAESRKVFERHGSVLPLPMREREYIAGIIGGHHDIDRFLSCQGDEHCAAELQKFRRENEHILIDLLIFYLCDFEGSKINFMVRRQKPQIWNKICGVLFDAFKERRAAKILFDDGAVKV